MVIRIYSKSIFRRCFPYGKRYWYKNIKGLPKYIKCIWHLIKYGYEEYAIWETYDWFVIIMRSILCDYRVGHRSVPILIENYPFDLSDNSDDAKKKRELNDKLWDSIIDKMISLLYDMDVNNPKYEEIDYLEQNKLLEEAKNEFFKLFSEHFYRLWD